MRILLLGGSGQLGFEIRKRALDLSFDLIAPVSSEVNVTDEQQVRFIAEQQRPDVVINCAAYTAVDNAETDRDTAFAINAEGPRKIAQVCKDLRSWLIHVSTDYVFDGSGRSPLDERQETRPINVYGESKLAGEQAILGLIPERAIVVRTSSLHGQKGVNFVNTMLKLFSERESVSVVADQWMSPTWAGWLAESILDLARLQVSGVVHASGSGVTTWYDFAAAILEHARHVNPHLRIQQLVPINSAEFGRPAKRPRYSVLDCTRLAGILGRGPITWQQGLQAHLSEIDEVRKKREV